MTSIRRLSNSHGLSLTELLISTIIVAIMVAGIFSSYYALQSMDRGASRRAAVAIELQAVVESIRQDAVKAVGTPALQGILWDDTETNSNYLCFRQDINSPSSFADDQWACYSRCTGNPRVHVFRCMRGTAGVCAPSDTFVGRAFINAPNLDFSDGLFKVLLVNRFDSTAGIAGSAASPTKGDENNPQEFFRLSVHPDGHSFN